MTDDFEELLGALRPRLHRYSARMTGSAIDGEDVVQDALMKAHQAMEGGAVIEDLEAWMFRVTHNAALDFLRRRRSEKLVPLPDDEEDRAESRPEAVTTSFRTFLALPELQRCAVILKDVLGHSIDEIADVASCSPAAAKSALQRGRTGLRKLAAAPGERTIPLLAEHDRQRLFRYVQMFRMGDFDGLRALLASDVELELVNRVRLYGRDEVAPYFSRYSEQPKWRFSPGMIEGRQAMLVFDRSRSSDDPSHFVLLEWDGEAIAGIRDFLFAAYAMGGLEWMLVD